MVRDSKKSTETKTIERIRKEYEAAGYEFIILPNSEDIPFFVKNYRPDAIARKGVENILIELKSSKISKKKSDAIRFLAKEVPKHANWEFQLMRDYSDADLVEPDLQPTMKEISKKIKALRKNLDAVAPEESLPFVWALLEATTRQTAYFDDPGKAAGKHFLPRTIIGRLLTTGLIEDEVSVRLYDLATKRNKIVHGYLKTKIERKDIEYILDLIDRLTSVDEAA